jgi:hypothetical protein
MACTPESTAARIVSVLEMDLIFTWEPLDICIDRIMKLDILVPYKIRLGGRDHLIYYVWSISQHTTKPALFRLAHRRLPLPNANLRSGVLEIITYYGSVSALYCVSNLGMGAKSVDVGHPLRRTTPFNFCTIDNIRHVVWKMKLMNSIHLELDVELMSQYCSIFCLDRINEKNGNVFMCRSQEDLGCRIR